MRRRAKPTFDLREWHSWYAWRPVKAKDRDGNNWWILRETVERKLDIWERHCTATYRVTV